MPYYEVANLVTITKTNMIDEMPCAYGTLRTTALRIRHQVSRRAAQRSQLLDNVFVYNRIPTEREQMAKLRSEGDMQRDAWYWRWARSNLPPGCL